MGYEHNHEKETTPFEVLNLEYGGCARRLSGLPPRANQRHLSL